MSDAPTKEKDQRSQIVETAERLFRQIGFQKTTVADIARELRMSPANVYRFFGSKSEINAAVARQLMSEV
jgi:AcrR family transcriptional regulator